VAEARLAVIVTLSKGYDLGYIWKQVDQSPAKDPAGYYIQASESGGEPLGHWWGPGAQALGLQPGQALTQACQHRCCDLKTGRWALPSETVLRP
jgi:hypothetical protein